MRLSAAVRSLKPSATIAAAAKAKQLKQQGVKVYDFTLGEPDFNTPEHIQEAARQAMAAGHTHYTPSGGVLELKQAVCRAYERDYGLKFTPAEVTISNGAKHAIHNVLTALCGPGDEVIIPTPYWVSYSALVELTGATPVLIATTPESGFCLSKAQLEAAITPKTRVLMLNSPSNPTGAVYPAALLEELARTCAARDIMILSDEIYEKLLYGGAEFRCVASFGKEVAEKTIIVSGVSKAYAMTGWRIGWSIAPVELNKAIDNLQSQETSNPCSVSQYAAIAALDGPQDCVREQLEQFTKRREDVVQRFRKIPNVRFVEPTGAFYLFFDVSDYFGKPLAGGRTVDNASDFCTALLEEAHVALVTGDAFGAPGYVRLSFASAMPLLAEGIDRIAGFLRG